MGKQINIGLAGTQFMGKAHSNAWLKVAQFFDIGVKPALHTACSRNATQLSQFANQFKWQHIETSWEKMVAAPDIDLIDICTPNDLHMPIAVAAAKAGKHIVCEKPIARNTQEAHEMYVAAKQAGVVH